MEYELFRSKLKPSVDRALITNMIEGSSSGERPHHTVAIRLILENSIQERRERMSVKAENTSRPRPGRKPETAAHPIREMEPPAPTPIPRSLSRPSPSPSFQSFFEKTGTSQFPLTSPQVLPKRVRVVQWEEPPAATEANPLPSEVIVELICERCRVECSRRSLCHKIYCPSCSPLSGVKCAHCGTSRTENVAICTGCHRKFKW